MRYMVMETGQTDYPYRQPTIEAYEGTMVIAEDHHAVQYFDTEFGNNGYKPVQCKVWFVGIDTLEELMEFVKGHGECVISQNRFNSDEWLIEIGRSC